MRNSLIPGKDTSRNQEIENREEKGQEFSKLQQVKLQ